MGINNFANTIVKCSFQKIAIIDHENIKLSPDWISDNNYSTLLLRLQCRLQSDDRKPWERLQTQRKRDCMHRRLQACNKLYSVKVASNESFAIVRLTCVSLLVSGRRDFKPCAQRQKRFENEQNSLKKNCWVVVYGSKRSPDSARNWVPCNLFKNRRR